MKSPSFVRNEFVGEQYAAIIGQAMGRPMSRVRLAGDMVTIQGARGATRNAPILVEHYADVVDGRVGRGVRPPAQKNTVSVGMVKVLDKIIENPDRHGENFLWVGSEKIPIDHGVINGGIGEPSILTQDRAKRILKREGYVDPPSSETFREIRAKIASLTEEQIDRIADKLAESFAVLEAADDQDKVKIDNTVFALRRNLKILKQAADDLIAGRP